VSKKLPFVKSDIPRDLRMFLDRVRELVSGSGSDRLVSLDDLTSAGIASSDSAGVLAAPLQTYLASPPPPINVTATSAVTTVFVEFDTPIYRGHAYAEIWGASSNVFASAVLLGLTPGGIYVDELGPGATRYYWVRFVNTNSTRGPFNATVGVSATTVPALEYTMDVLAKAYGDTSEAPFFQLDAPLIIDGVAIPAGTYMKSAFIYNGVITNAKIGNLAVDSAKIADLAVGTAKITDLAVTTGKIDNLAVSTAKIADLAVGTAQIADLAVSTAKIADLAVGTAQIADLAVGTAKINSLAVTSAKIDNLAVSTAKIGDLAVSTLKIQDQAVSTTRYNVFDYSPPQGPSALTTLTNYSATVANSGDYIIILSMSRAQVISGFTYGSSSITQEFELLVDGVRSVYGINAFSDSAVPVNFGTRVQNLSAGTHNFEFRYRYTGSNVTLTGSGITQLRVYLFGAYK